jgi:hypothetical protein
MPDAEGSVPSASSALAAPGSENACLANPAGKRPGGVGTHLVRSAVPLYQVNSGSSTHDLASRAGTAHCS